MEDKKNEQVIYFSDLLFSVLYRWKSILATVIIVSVLFAAVKGISDYYTIRSADEETALSDQELVEQYEAQQESLTLKIQVAQENIKNQKKYLDNSLYMKLDPYGFYRTDITLFVDVNWKVMPGMTYQDPNRTATVIAAYQQVLLGDEALKAVGDAIGADPVYLLEIMQIVPGTDGIMIVVINTPQKDQAEIMAEQILVHIEKNCPAISQQVAEHSVTEVERSIRLVQNLDVANAQRNATDRIAGFFADLDAAELALEALKKPQTTADISVWKSSVKFAAIGGILGFAATVVVFLILSLLDDRVYSARSLRDRTGLKIVCSVCTRKTKGVDLWLRKLERRSFSEIDTQAAITAVTLKNYYPNLSRLVIAGDLPKEKRQEFTEALTKELANVQVVDQGCALESVNTLQALTDCDMVLMMAECGTSRYRDLAEETKVICNHGKKIAGCVVLNG